VVTTPETPYQWGKANVVRYRGAQDLFIDAFEWFLAADYADEGEDLSIIACGPSVPEAMRAAYILKEDLGLETRVVDMHSVKPLDTDAIVRAAAETGLVITAEEHQVGGFGNWISAAIAQSKEMYGRPILMGMIGVQDRFGESGEPWELVKEFEVSAEHIARMARDLVSFKKEKGASR
jgi:transketolase